MQIPPGVLCKQHLATPNIVGMAKSEQRCSLWDGTPFFFPKEENQLHKTSINANEAIQIFM